MRWYWWLGFGALAIGLLFLISSSDLTVKIGDVSIESIPEDDDIEAMGRMIASETYPNDPLLAKQGVAWAARNEAGRVGKTVASLLMPGGVPGTQSGRYASTASAGTSSSKAIAFDVLSGKTPDPTGGAIQFDAPETQDKLYAAGKVRLDANGVAASRESDGKEVSLTVPGTRSSYRFWRYA